MENPYQDEGNIRTFDSSAPSYEYVWHRDDETRIIEVLEGDGWQFQRNDSLPFLLQPGMVFRIQESVYHRLIKGTNDLKVKITKINK